MKLILLTIGLLGLAFAGITVLFNSRGKVDIYFSVSTESVRNIFGAPMSRFFAVKMQVGFKIPAKR